MSRPRSPRPNGAERSAKTMKKKIPEKKARTMTPPEKSMEVPPGVIPVYARIFEATYTESIVLLKIGTDFARGCEKIAHTVIVISPYDAVGLRDLMIEIVDRYEKSHGTID